MYFFSISETKAGIIRKIQYRSMLIFLLYLSFYGVQQCAQIYVKYGVTPTIKIYWCIKKIYTFKIVRVRNNAEKQRLDKSNRERREPIFGGADMLGTSLQWFC